MESLKPDCSDALRRKRPQSLPAAMSRTLSPVRFERKRMRNCAHFLQFPEQSRRISLHFRLYGGAGSLTLTFLCPNSLLTREFNRNFENFGPFVVSGLRGKKL